MSPKRSWDVWIGWDPLEVDANLVAQASLTRRSSLPVALHRIDCRPLQELGFYTRPTAIRPESGYWDHVSGAPMTTGHAIARFFIPYLMHYRGWSLFVDGDVLFRSDVAALFAWADPTKALQVVQHPPMTVDPLKKGGQLQTAYARKNWSSVILWNCEHPAHRQLTLGVLNTWPGRDLHAFSWLRDEDIGELPLGFNWLVGVSAPEPDPAIVHYTLGVPTVVGHEADPYADEWRAVHAQRFERQAVERLEPQAVTR